MEIKEYIETFADLKQFVENADELISDGATITLNADTNEIIITDDN